MENMKDSWVAPENAILPDFIICGAMKSATSTLHFILNQHPQVFIPDSEIGFFDIDNIFQHPDFIFFDRNEWVYQTMEGNEKKMWEWYSAHFDPGEQGQVLGEDSTSYLVSERAAKRISLQEREIKIIVMLRQPTMRAYSQYWHMVRTGRATHSFENTIKFYPESILKRSMYLKQLQQWLKFVPREQMEIIIFEDFITDRENQLRKICNLIDLDYNKLPGELFDIKKNTARLSLFPRINIYKNRLFREFGNSRYLDLLPNTTSKKAKFRTLMSKIVSGLHLIINPPLRKKKPKIKRSTKRFLDDYFKKEFEGINEIIGKDVISMWFDS